MNVSYHLLAYSAQKVRWMTVVDIYTFSHFAWAGVGCRPQPQTSLLQSAAAPELTSAPCSGPSS